MFSHCTGGRIEAPRSSAEGARIEAPRGVRCGEECPLPTGGWDLRRGLCPLSKKFWISDIKMVSFCAFWVVLFTVYLPVLSQTSTDCRTHQDPGGLLMGSISFKRYGCRLNQVDCMRA